MLKNPTLLERKDVENAPRKSELNPNGGGHIGKIKILEKKVEIC